MTTVLGSWRIRISTPIGTVQADVEFVEADGALRGIARGKDEEVALRDIVVVAGDDGEHVTWSQSITRPMRLNLDFEVVVVGDSMSGVSRAGRLPKSRVSGARLTVE